MNLDLVEELKILMPKHLYNYHAGKETLFSIYHCHCYFFK